MASMGSGYNMP